MVLKDEAVGHEVVRQGAEQHGRSTGGFWRELNISQTGGDYQVRAQRCGLRDLVTPVPQRPASNTRDRGVAPSPATVPDEVLDGGKLEHQRSGSDR
jgi:hypothetical protein